MRTETPESTLDASEQDLARKLRKQVAEWKAMRAPIMALTVAGVRVERRPRRKSITEKRFA